jgi:multiple sugar transport system ATP-binding protein
MTLATPGTIVGPAPTALALRGIRRTFGTTTALADIDLDIRAGSLTVVVGPSGCGKSTLLRILAGLDQPDDGRLLAADVDVTGNPVGSRDVGMVFQDYALFPHMTVEQNISFGLRLARRHDRRNGPTREQIDSEVLRVAGLFGLEALLDRRPSQLSGGQRQRVALARAVIRRPSVLLLDEPLSALDVALRASARAEILRLHRDLGTTLVLVTHDQHEALSVATDLVVMDDGRVAQAGTPEEVYRRPGSRFVAGFVGSPAMNLSTSTDGTTTGWRPPDARAVVPATGAGSSVAAAGPSGTTDLLVDGTVDVCEFTGAGQEVLCRDADGSTFTLVQRDGERWLRPGDRVRAHVPARAVHRFAADGTRIGD